MDRRANAVKTSQHASIYTPSNEMSVTKTFQMHWHISDW